MPRPPLPIRNNRSADSLRLARLVERRRLLKTRSNDQLDRTETGRKRRRTGRALARLTVVLGFSVATAWLVYPLLQTPANISDADHGFITLVAESNTVPLAVAAADLHVADTTVGRNSSPYDTGLSMTVGLPGWSRLWAFIEWTGPGDVYCSAPGAETDDVSRADLPEWVLGAASVAPDPNLIIVSWTGDPSQPSLVTCGSINQSDDWLKSGANTLTAFIPDLTVTIQTAAGQPATASGVQDRTQTQSIDLPTNYTWRTSDANPAFTITGLDATRSVPCECIVNQRQIYAAWFGAAISVVDDQAQAQAVPRGLIAGAALGVVAQLIFDGLSQIFTWLLARRRRDN